METLTETILGAGWKDRVLTEEQLARLLGGSPQRRYNLVNRAIHRGELLRLRRGRYALAPSVAGSLPHPFVIAQALNPGSYVSFETALDFHGWIPEAVALTWSVTPGRRSLEVDVPQVGAFRFSPLAVVRGYFLEGVDRRSFDGQAALVAQPVRALLDLFYVRKLDGPAAHQEAAGLRIDADALAGLRAESLAPLRAVYGQRRMARLIDALQRERAP